MPNTDVTWYARAGVAMYIEGVVVGDGIDSLSGLRKVEWEGAMEVVTIQGGTPPSLLEVLGVLTKEGQG